jgi:hypothetical protein
MISTADAITLTIPRSIVPELPALSQDLNDRMHELLERNTEGTLDETERAELKTLVQMAQFAQILAMMTQGATVP